MTIDPSAPLFQALIVALAALLVVPPLLAALVDGYAAIVLAHAQADAIRLSARRSPRGS